MRTHKLLASVLVLQMLILMTLWLGGPISRAQAQVPDSGAQNNQIIDQLKSSNDKLDKMISILESGKLQVVVSKPDDTQQK